MARKNCRQEWEGVGGRTANRKRKKLFPMNGIEMNKNQHTLRLNMPNVVCHRTHTANTAKWQ